MISYIYKEKEEEKKSVGLSIAIKLFFFFGFLYLINSKPYKKIYVTLTSWKGRINYIYQNLERLLNNSIKPKKLILNLSIEEFPKKNLELPFEILNLLKKYNNFEIFWVKKNNNIFKKLIPTLNRFKTDIIIAVDDDILYPKNLFEKMLKCYKKLGKNNPVSFGPECSDWNISGKIINSHYGGGSIVSYKYFNNKINEIYQYTTEDRINKGIKCPDDALYTYAALLNGYKYMRCKDYYVTHYSEISLHLRKPFSEGKNKNYSKLSDQYHTIITEYIEKKYNVSIEQLIEKAQTFYLTNKQKHSNYN
jgi:hypothetical protein